MQHYVLGFVFDPSEYRLLLIEKNRPKWQAGKLNGIGGKVEPDESPLAAMVREFSEEAFLTIPASAWQHFGVMEGQDFVVWCFRARTADFDQARSLTDEPVVVVDARDFNDIGLRGVSNLVTLVAHALDPDRSFLQMSYRELGAARSATYDVEARLS